MSALNATLSAVPASLTGIRDAALADLRLPVAGAVTLALAGGLLVLFKPPKYIDDSGVVQLGGLSSLTALPFFTKRHTFILNGIKKVKKLGENLFQFRFLQNTIVIVSGEEGRKTFYNDKYLDFTQGYQVLVGGAPRLEQSSESDFVPENMTWFNKHVAMLFNKQRLGDVLPSLLDDIHASMMTTMGPKEGVIDPFKDIYNLIIQMTIRMVSCRAISNDPKAVAEMWGYFDTIERSTTPFTLMMPWLPTFARGKKERATTGLFQFLNRYIDERRNSTPSADAFDVLIAEGLDNQQIVGFAMIIIFAGITNTSVNSCWILIYLCLHLEWKEKCLKEVQDLLANHSNPDYRNDPLHKRLASIPITAWENELPTIDLCLKETLRLTHTGAGFRRNTKGPLDIANKVVKRGWFLVYLSDDVHQNPDIYNNPRSFDPERFLPGREEDKKQAYSFVGWGGGRHPCSGIKFAKLEIRMIVALFLLGYEYDLVDKNGNFPKNYPVHDVNDLQRAAPYGDRVFLKYKRLVD